MHARPEIREILISHKLQRWCPDWATPACVPELLALAGKAQLRKAIRATRGASPSSGLDPGVGVPADLTTRNPTHGKHRYG